MLTAAQLEHYHTFGYVVFKQLLKPVEVTSMRREMYAELGHMYTHQPFDGDRRQWTTMLTERTPFFVSLFDDERFIGVADQLFGSALPVWCDANRYADPTTGWHPDTSASFDQAAIKFLIYLQPLTASTGALRVIPGSHKRPLYDDVRAYLEKYSPEVHEVPAMPMETRPGDVVAFNINMWHAAAHASNDRHLCTLAYFPDPKTPHEEANIYEHVRWILDVSSKGFAWNGDPYPESWKENRSNHPRRAKAIARMREIGIFDAADLAMRRHAVAP
jgi:hypothetical protein